MTWIQSTALLKSTPEGTFLVRDSSDPRFLYTLSVQRGPDEGPTSVRIHFSDGKFRLDAEDKIQNLMPAFTSVVDLVEHYSRQHKSAKSHIWIDMGGQISPSIWLKAPLLKKVPTLAHSARLTVHQNLESQQHQLEDMQRLFKLPYLLTRYLQEYPLSSTYCSPKFGISTASVRRYATTIQATLFVNQIFTRISTQLDLLFTKIWNLNSIS